MVLHFGDMLERIANMVAISIKILIIWGDFDNLYGSVFFFLFSGMMRKLAKNTATLNFQC
jgi:hypothetical protein